MSEALILDIFKNFEKEFKQFKKKGKGGLIGEYFKEVGMKKARYYMFKNTKREFVGVTRKKRVHGKTVMRYKENDYYIGGFVNGQKEGRGYHHFPNGVVFKGEYLAGKKIKGIVFNLKDKSIVYEGGWKNDTYSGHGRLHKPGGSFYEGQFKNGKFNGKGKLTWKNGSFYEGSFHKGQREGQGKHVFETGDQYEGEFKENKFDGQGTFRWKTLDEYKGLFRNGRMIGSGIMGYRQLGIQGSGIWDKEGSSQSIQFELENGTNKELF